MTDDTTTLKGLRAPERLTLMDLAPRRAVVSLSTGQELEVRCLSAADVLRLLDEHIALRKYMERIPLSYLEIAQTAPAAVPVAIALGCGYGGNKEAEQIAASLALQDQVDILAGIGGVTFTRGFGPFAEAMRSLGVELDFVTSEVGKERVTPSRKTRRRSSPALANLKRGSSHSPRAKSPRTPS